MLIKPLMLGVSITLALLSLTILLRFLIYPLWLNIKSKRKQTTNIDTKTEQDMNKRKKKKKKYYDILLSDFSESDNMNIINKGFLKNSEGQYQRGNYILVKEGETYLAIHKNKLKGGN